MSNDANKCGFIKIIMESFQKTSNKCGFMDCLLPSNRKEYYIRICLTLFGLAVTTCTIWYANACGLYNYWSILLWCLYFFQIIVLTVSYYYLKDPHDRCLFYSKACANKNHAYSLLIILLNLQILYFIMCHDCNRVSTFIKYFLILTVAFRAIEMMMDIIY